SSCMSVVEMVDSLRWRRDGGSPGLVPTLPDRTSCQPSPSPRAGGHAAAALPGWLIPRGDAPVVLYHLDDPHGAIAEARRIPGPDRVYFAATSARDNDPEIMPEGYPRSTFDAEEAEDIVGSVFDSAVAQRWGASLFELESRAECRAV